jgi:hypothetical protein
MNDDPPSLYGKYHNLTEIELAPLLPRPGTVALSPRIQADMIGKVREHARLFDSICELHVITNDVVWQYYGVTKRELSKELTVAVAEAAYQRLLSWAANLPPSQVRGTPCSHSVLILQ